MTAVLPVLLLAFAGLLLGGTISLRRQGASPIAVAVSGGLAVLASVGGVLWLARGDS